MRAKRIILVLSMIMLNVVTLFAQAPQGLTYQAVVRDNKGQLVSNATVGVKISILQGSSTGTIAFSDEFRPQTNANGLFSVIIGGGMNSINVIDWADGPYYLKSEVDPNGSNNYTISTVQQLLSVPYALYAQTASQIKNLPNPTDSTDAVNLRTVVSLLNSMTHYYDSIINNLSKTIDSLRQNIDTTSSGGFSSALFSVSASQKVLFSPGNLEYSTMGSHAVAGGVTATGTWRFAPNQWDMIGSANSNISSTYTGWIDLFGWGTSGYNNKYPYMTSTTDTDYGNENNNISGTNYDWGVYNAIYNPKTNTTDAPGTWRTLTKDEWVYLLNTRPTLSSIRYAKATVCGIAGLIIVPDSCASTYYPLTNVNTSGADFTTNIIGSTDWSKMEAVGCVFLPAAGYRWTSVSSTNSGGYYWSATYNNSYYAFCLYFSSSNLDFSTGLTRYRHSGNSVRLVRDVTQ